MLHLLVQVKVQASPVPLRVPVGSLALAMVPSCDQTMVCGVTSCRCCEGAAVAALAVAAHDDCQCSSAAQGQGRCHGHAFAALMGPLAGVSCREDQLAAGAVLAVPEAEVVTGSEEVEFENCPFRRRRSDRRHRGRSCRPWSVVVCWMHHRFLLC